MAQIVIDGRQLEVDPKRNLLEVALEQGFDVPYFCWHPAMGSVGACRQCAVTQFRDENDTQGRVVMACMTACGDNTRYSVVHDDAGAMRKAVIEYLMTNHPHDCPVCEEGGQCHLQDMTVMTGHEYRQYRHTKRTHVNQDLGPFIGHEMNRCIACYRCVRFYREYAGGTDLDVFGAHNHVYFGRAESGTLESPFSGNLVEVCPTGVFTDKTFSQSYTRKWDLQQAPSVCQSCSVGCNTLPGERYNRLKRVENRYHGALNGYFICDRGRFGYEHVNAEDRPRMTLKRGADGQQPVDVQAALDALSAARGPRTLGIGSPRASLEANHALRAFVGSAQFHRGIAAADTALDDLLLNILQTTPAHIATIPDIEEADAVLVLGEDVLGTAARVALALRQSVRQAGFEMADEQRIPRWQDHSVRLLAQETRSPLFVATVDANWLDDVAEASYRGTPTAQAQLAQAVVHRIDATQPDAAGLDAQTLALAQHIADAFRSAQRPLIVSGVGAGSAAVLAAAANVATALHRSGKAVSMALLPSKANSLGTAMLGGADLEAALARIESGEIDTLIVVENDLYRQLPAARIDAALGKLKQLIVIDSVATPTTARADWLLPAGSFAETDGTFVNYEGRAQRSYQVFVAQDADTRESWRWLQQAADGVLGEALDDLTQACAAATPTLARIVDAAPNARFRIAGQRIPRQSHRYSGRTAMNAKRDVHEPRPPQDADSPLAFSMEGARVGVPAAEIPIFWYPKWNSNQSVSKFQAEINGPLKGGDPGVFLIDSNGQEAGQGSYLPLAQEVSTGWAWLHEIFGSDELSARGPAIAQRTPAPYVAVNAAYASRLGVSDGGKVRVRVNGSQWNARLRVSASMAADVVGIPRGLPGMPSLDASASVSIEGAA